MKMGWFIIFFVLLNLCTVLPALSAPQNRNCDFTIEMPLEFADETIDSCISRADIKRLMNKKVRVGSSYEDAYKFLWSDTGRVRVETCGEYLEAIRQGASSSGNTFDISMQSFFIYTCGILSALQSAEKANKSFLPDDKLNDLGTLPVVLLLGDKDELIKKSNAGSTIADYLENYIASISESTSESLELIDYGIAKSDTIELRELTPEDMEAGAWEMYIRSIARADFNKDGIEDILVWVTYHSVRGSGRDYTLTLLTRTSKTQKIFEVLAEYLKCQYKDSKYECSSEFGWSPFD